MRSRVLRQIQAKGKACCEVVENTEKQVERGVYMQEDAMKKAFAKSKLVTEIPTDAVYIGTVESKRCDIAVYKTEKGFIHMPVHGKEVDSHGPNK